MYRKWNEHGVDDSKSTTLKRLHELGFNFHEWNKVKKKKAFMVVWIWGENINEIWNQCNSMDLHGCRLSWKAMVSLKKGLILRNPWDFLIPSSEDLCGDDFISQHDVASSHRSVPTKNWLKKHQINLFFWPISLDLNAIENFWGIMKKSYCSKHQSWTSF